MVKHKLKSKKKIKKKVTLCKNLCQKDNWDPWLIWDVLEHDWRTFRKFPFLKVPYFNRYFHEFSREKNPIFRDFAEWVNYAFWKNDYMLLHNTTEILPDDLKYKKPNMSKYLNYTDAYIDKKLIKPYNPYSKYLVYYKLNKIYNLIELKLYPIMNQQLPLFHLYSMVFMDYQEFLYQEQYLKIKEEVEVLQDSDYKNKLVAILKEAKKLFDVYKHYRVNYYSLYDNYSKIFYNNLQILEEDIYRNTYVGSDCQNILDQGELLSRYFVILRYLNFDLEKKRQDWELLYTEYNQEYIKNNN